ncbi:MAG: hypothetical protein AAGG72_06145 [Pseudomonadota bacterium]
MLIGHIRRREAWCNPVCRRTFAVDPIQDAWKHPAGQRRLRQLENSVSGVAHEPRARLEIPPAQQVERPRLDAARRRDCPQDVGEGVGQRIELGPDDVGGEAYAGSRVYLRACFPSSIHCSAAPRPWQKASTRSFGSCGW